MLNKIITEYKLTEEFIERFDNILDWNLISWKQILSETFIEKYQDKLNWYNISCNQTLSESFIEKYQNKVIWHSLSHGQILSEKFIEKFQDKVDWHYISWWQTLSESFIDKFVKNVSLENIKYGITSNTIQLGYFDGGMTYKIPEENLKKIQQTIGLNRFGKIEELTNTIKFIIENEYVTGVNIKIDGGLQ